jgi:hypothetical protein
MKEEKWGKKKREVKKIRKETRSKERNMIKIENGK